jgi:hypothetical protein
MRRREFIALFGSAAMWPGALNAKVTRTHSEDLGRFLPVRVAVVEVKLPDVAPRSGREGARSHAPMPTSARCSRCCSADRVGHLVFP